MRNWGRVRRTIAACLAAHACAPAMIEAQTIPYVGGVAGISTLSADGRASISADAAAVSLYAPENGLAVNLFAGVHLSDYVSVQGNYIANSNRLTLTASTGSDRGGCGPISRLVSVWFAFASDAVELGARHGISRSPHAGSHRSQPS